MCVRMGNAHSQVHLPIGEKQNFKGVVDIIGMKSYMGDGKTTADIPAELQEAAEAAHFALVEAAAEGEDELMEKYLENGSLSDEEMVRGLEDVVYAGAFVPIFCAAGGREIGSIASAQRHHRPDAIPVECSRTCGAGERWRREADSLRH